MVAMHTLTTSAVSMSERELLSVIGQEHADLIYRLDRAHLEYGRHYSYAHRVTVYTEAGLRELVGRLAADGCQVASHCLRVELDQRHKTPSRALIPAGRKNAEPYYRRGDLA